jgi:hypothetical protein
VVALNFFLTNTVLFGASTSSAASTPSPGARAARASRLGSSRSEGKPKAGAASRAVPTCAINDRETGRSHGSPPAVYKLAVKLPVKPLPEPVAVKE